MKRMFCLFALFAFVSLVAYADIAIPKPTPKPKQEKMIDSRMTIRFDETANETILVIPKSHLKQFRAELESLDEGVDANAVLTDSSGGFSRTQTIIGGMFVSLAFVFGGVWLARTRKADGKTSKKIVAGIVLFFAGSAATLVFANAGPPSALRSISSKLFDKKVFGYWKRADGNIKIRVSEENARVELIVPDKEEKANKDAE